MVAPYDEPDDLDDPEVPEPRSLEVHVTDNEVVVLYSVDGEPLLELYERAVVPFGFVVP